MVVATLVATGVAQITIEGPSGTHELGGSMIAVVVGALALAVLVSESDRPEIGEVGIIALVVNVGGVAAIHMGETAVTEPIFSNSPWTGYGLALAGLLAYYAIVSRGELREELLG